MALSNTATPIYYGRFREAVMRGEIPVCREISMEMNRIDDLIANPGIWYDDKAVNGFIAFCEDELTLTDGTDVKMLESFKLWAEEIFGWYYFVERSVFVPNEHGAGKGPGAEVHDRRQFAEHDRLEGRPRQDGQHKEGHRELPDEQPAGSAPDDH